MLINLDLFAEIPDVEVIPWRPQVLDHASWPPDYKGVYAWRIKQLALINSSDDMLRGAKEYYRTHRVEFIMHWMDTFDPRKTDGTPKWVPFVLFKRQAYYIQFLEECERDQQCGLVEKSRDVGLTWLSCAYAVHKWLFETASSSGFGSRSEKLVDRIGDDDSIFEKIRKIIRHLPKCFLPKGFNRKDHLLSMRILNPENGAQITGEVGDNIGRGGRKGIYWEDESAHYEHPDLIEAALGDNTNVQIEISSVNGIGNLFERKRHSQEAEEWEPGKVIPFGKTRVFIVDWRDHPGKTLAWYNLRKKKAMADGNLHIFAQEVDRDYSGAIENTVIPFEWVMAAVWADKAKGISTLDYLLSKWPDKDWTGGNWSAGLDVADGGGDTNALTKRRGIVLKYCEEWGERDPGVTARRTIAECMQHVGIAVQYDPIGVGSSVKSEYNRLLLDEKLFTTAQIQMVPWNAGDSVLNPFDRVNSDDPKSVINKDFYANLKAQAWWALRLRFWKTFQAVTLGTYYPPEELIIIDPTLTNLSKLTKELAQPTFGKSVGQLKMLINKKPDGSKSPNLADSIVMCYYPLPGDFMGSYTGSYGAGDNPLVGYRHRQAA